MRSDDKMWIMPNIKHLMNMWDKAFKKGDHGAVLISQKNLNIAIQSSMNKSTSKHLNN